MHSIPRMVVKSREKPALRPDRTSAWTLGAVWAQRLPSYCSQALGRLQSHGKAWESFPLLRDRQSLGERKEKFKNWLSCISSSWTPGCLKSTAPSQHTLINQ